VIELVLGHCFTHCIILSILIEYGILYHNVSRETTGQIDAYI
jgi:hypothetical protein